MRAAIVAVGSELLGPDRLDTNSLLLTAILRRHGVELVRKVVVGDEREEIATEIGRLMRRCGLVLVSGGLGPTRDDLTREAVAGLLGRELVLDETLLAGIAAKFARFGMKMPEVNRKQAEVIEGSEVLENRRGTAPGLRLEHGGSALFLFPGVPGELEALAASALEPWLERHAGDGALESLVLRVACLPESGLEQTIQPYYEKFGRRGLSVLAAAADIQLRITAAGSGAERAAALEERARLLEELLGEAIYTRRDGQTLEQVVGAALLRAGRTVATAESCTGGLVAERLTRVPGSSGYFVGAAVTYADRLKSELLGVPAGLLTEHGAVSEPVVTAMARGVRSRLGSDFGIGISGIAGPGGGSEEKPVGTVHVAVAGPGAEELVHRRLRLPGDRERVRQIASQWALDLLRRRLAPAPARAATG